MRCHAAPLTWACIGLLLLGLLQLAGCAEVDNKLAHARERIYLWEMHEIFVDIEGVDKQDIIFPQNKKSKWTQYKHYSLINTIDGRLTYSEFMSDFEMKLKPGLVDNSLVAPNGEGKGVPTVAEAVDDLKTRGWAMTMDVNQVTSGRTKDYAELLGRVDKKVDDYFEKLKDDPKWNRKLIEVNMRTHKLAGEIAAVRRQEAEEWLIRQLTRDVDAKEDRKYGLGLSRDDLVITTERSTVPGATTYDKVHLPESFMEHPDQADFLRKLNAAGIKDGMIGLTN
ncbi:hypothetical protein FSARC_7462 [Fusarium sarcochroum]|uniref:Uncharacterized protein n=1 Tax=Fusarium sarcochroum TaxID=1208366 RepID=A0A8H4X8A5_9HYPO|nr:hypothetical protein FSARC_7462 [Fusarium sarcochroum]